MKIIFIIIKLKLIKQNNTLYPSKATSDIYKYIYLTLVVLVYEERAIFIQIHISI